jgi:two-component system repressor protein LuxO
MIGTLSQGGTTVLVVEDDGSLRTLFLALLRRYGFAVECANDGAEAIARLERKRYDVVVLDLMIPVVNGFDVLRHLAAKDPALLRRVVVTTGVSDKVLRTIDAGSVFSVLRKPFDIDMLVQTIADCCARNRAAETGSAEELHREAAQRFGERAPELRQILRDSCASPEETLLRQELRRVVGELGVVLDTAAHVTHNAVLSYGFTRMAGTARELAGVTARGVQRDH